MPVVNSESPDRYDVIVIGAGVTGLAALYLLREKGLRVRLFEEGSGVGGVWYWNRYPGCRFDTYSPTYAYSFCAELLREWDWTETYAAQPENERYLNFAADKLGLRPDITLNARVTGAAFDEASRDWLVEFEDGSRARCQFLVTAVGRFSSRYVPRYPGLDGFRGTWVHTGRWPREGVDLAGKRVAVIGTGATGVQVIPQAARVASQLTVFQRTANYCVPIDNEPITARAMADIKASYDEIFRLCEDSPVLELDRPDPRSGLDVPAEERLALYEEMWKNPGVAPKFIPLFYDVMVPGPVNEEYSEFVKGKIRERVADPVLAEKLVPSDHTFAAKRPPGETGYYEVYNQGNVELVDLRENPIEAITPAGIKTRDGEYPVDVIIFATGWDVLTGALLSMRITGEGGLTLEDKFAAGLRSYLFIQSAGFPNLFLINASVSGSFVRSVEPLIGWLADTMCYVREHGYRSIAPRPEAEEAWTAHACEAASKLLMGQASSALIGANIPGKPRVPLLPPEGEHSMRDRRRAEADNGYPGFELR